MEKRYQVFVSSTYDDLKEERGKVITALLNIDCIPCGMEYFPATDEDAWQCIERLIPECDYYVIILAGRYGSTPKNSTKSYIHQEYDLAMKHGIPVISLLHADPMKLPNEKCEQDIKYRKKLEKFRLEVGRKLCKFWTTGDQLAAELLSSLTNQIKKKPRPGWVRSNSLADSDAKDEIIKLRRKIEEQEKRIKELTNKESEAHDQLASGDDLLAISASMWGYDEENNYSATTYLQAYSTWNAALRFIRLNYPHQWNRWDLKKSLESVIQDATAILPDAQYKHSSRVEIDFEEIDKILAQFNALSIIRKKGSGWDFTPKGLTTASAMMALRKGETHLPDASSWFQLKIIGTSPPHKYNYLI